MSRVIYKYEFGTNPLMQMTMCDPQVVLVAPQSVSTFPTVWIEHDLDLAPDTVITMEVVGTGQPLTDSMSHVGSAVCGPFVWHVYGKTEPVK